MYVSFSLLKTKFTKNIVISNHKILKCYMEVMLIINYFKNNLKEYFGFIDYQWKKNMEKGFLSIYVRTFNNKKSSAWSLHNMLSLSKIAVHSTE